MTAQHIFCGSFVLTLISIGCFYAFFNPKPSMTTFKRAGTKEDTQKIWNAWGTEGQTKALRNLAFDWFFIVIYSTMWISGAMYLGPLVDPTLRIPAMLFAGIGLAGALCDVIENACLRKMLHGNDSETAPRICKRVIADQRRTVLYSGYLFSDRCDRGMPRPSPVILSEVDAGVDA